MATNKIKIRIIPIRIMPIRKVIHRLMISFGLNFTLLLRKRKTWWEKIISIEKWFQGGTNVIIYVLWQFQRILNKINSY